MIKKNNSNFINITNMTKLYLRSLTIEDTGFIKLFKGMFPKEDNIDFDAIPTKALITNEWVKFPQKGDK